MGMHVGGKSVLKRTSADNRWMILSTGSYLVTAFYDDTKVYANGSLVDTVDKQEIKTLSFSANDIISSNKPISFSISGNGQTALCYAFQGTQFAHEWDRYPISFYIVATTNESTNVTVTYGASTSFWTGTVGTSSYTTVTPSSYGRYIIESDNPIAVYAGDLPSYDCMPLYPCSLELFGTASSGGHIIAVEDSTSITEYSTSGSSTSYTMNRGDYRAVTYTGDSQFAGASVRLVADKPIAAESQADADGGEMTPFIGKDGFGTQFVIPENEREFVKIVSDVPAVIKAYDTSGTLLSTTTLTGSATTGVYNALLTGTSSYEGVLIESDLPVTAIYEGENDDETILFAHQPDRFSVEYGPRIVTDGLVLCLDAANSKSYPGTGTTWTDLSGNGNNATLSSSTFTSAGAESYFQFSGSGAATVSSFSKTISNQMTMEVVYMSSSTDTFTTYGRIVDRGDTTISLGTYSTYQLRMWTYAGGSRSSESQVNGIGQDGKWHHVVYTYDGSNVALYLDGVYQNGYAKTGNLENPAAITLGNGDGYLFGGRIAMFRYYESGFTTAEIQQNFSALRGRYSI